MRLDFNTSAWTGITPGSGTGTTANGDSALVYQTAQTTAGRISWRFTESTASTSTGTPVLFQVDTIAASNALPMLVLSRGTEVFRVSATAPQLQFADGSTWGTAGASLASGKTFAFSGGSQLLNDAANVAALQNGVNAQTLRVYGTTTGAKYCSLSHDGTNTILDSSSGVLIFGGTAVKTAFPIGSAANPSIATSSGSTTGFFFPTTGLIAVSIAGVETTRWTPTAFQPGSAGTIDLGLALQGFKRLYLDYTNTATVGAVTINKASGRVNLAAAGTTLTVTNSLVTAASHIYLNADSAPGNAVAVQLFAVPAAGSFTINAVPAVTNQTAIDFLVINAD